MDGFSPPASTPRQRPSLLFAVLLLLVVPPLIHGIGGAITGYSAHAEFVTAAAVYDDLYDPIVIRDGTVSAGPRIVHLEEDGRTILVDPDETVPTSAVTANDAFIVRRTEFIRIQPFRTQHTDIAELQDFFGIDEMIIDSANVTTWLEDHLLHVVGGMAVFFMLASITDWLTLSVYALVGAAASRAAFGEDAPFSQAFAVGLLVGLPTIVFGWGLWAVGFPLGCMGPLVWGTFITVGTVAGMLVIRQ